MTEQRIGNYIIEEPVGRGGMGVVYRGRHATLPRVVAIKSIDPRGTHDLRRLRHRFEREAYVQSQLDHPAIVKIYDYIVSEQTYHIVMEYVEGRSLARAARTQKGDGSASSARSIFSNRYSNAVAYAHNFVYRDEDGRNAPRHRSIATSSRRTSWSRGRPHQGHRLRHRQAGRRDRPRTRRSLVYGSPRYVSPEQAAGEHVDQRSDITRSASSSTRCWRARRPSADESGRRACRARNAARARRAAAATALRAESGNHAELERVDPARPRKRARSGASPSAFEFCARDQTRARARHAGDRRAEASLSKTPAREKPDTGRLAGVTAEVARDTYHTQPIR